MRDRGQHEKLGYAPPPSPSIAQDAAAGARGGTLVAGGMLTVALVRLAFAVAAGYRFARPSAQDLFTLLYILVDLVGSVSLAGAVLGGAKRWLETTQREYLAYAAAGTFVGVALAPAFARAEHQPLSLAMVIFGAVYGPLMACVLLHAIRRAAQKKTSRAALPPESR